MAVYKHELIPPQLPEGVEVISALPAGMSVPQGMQRAGENLREAVRFFFSDQRQEP